MEIVEKACAVVSVLWAGFWCLVWASDSLGGIEHYGPIIALPIVFLFGMLKAIRWVLS